MPIFKIHDTWDHVFLEILRDDHAAEACGTNSILEFQKVDTCSECESVAVMIRGEWFHSPAVRFESIPVHRARVETPKGDDPVNHPKHYTSDPSGVECIEITRHRNFNIGNAMKYLWRAGLKNLEGDALKAEIQDLNKAVWYINDEIDRLSKDR